MNLLNEAQRATIKSHVGAIVSYYETEQELTDHLITAIEDRGLLAEGATDDELFGAINSVVEEDFGGFATIIRQEEDRMESYFECSRNLYLQHYASWFRRPYVWFVLVVFLLAMYFSAGVLSEWQIKLMITIGMLLIPLGTLVVYWLSYYGEKPSIKRKGIVNYGMLPVHLSNFLVLGLDAFLPLDKSLLFDYPLSFLYAGILITFSVLTALVSAGISKEEMHVLVTK